MKEKIRHLYDLTILFGDPEIEKFVQTKAFSKMIDEARSGDKQIPGMEEIAPKPWASAVIFTDSKGTLSRLRDTYNSQLGPLVFDRQSMPSMKDIEKMLKSVTRKL
ncbi:MAG: hypothetical protein K2X47_00210 [Bdellovibrionales bacterium]|nr:hypothetical protein [Bdellovibrionales bacterium]